MKKYQTLTVVVAEVVVEVVATSSQLPGSIVSVGSHLAPFASQSAFVSQSSYGDLLHASVPSVMRSHSEFVWQLILLSCLQPQEEVQVEPPVSPPPVVVVVVAAVVDAEAELVVLVVPQPPQHLSLPLPSHVRLSQQVVPPLHGSPRAVQPVDGGARWRPCSRTIASLPCTRRRGGAASPPPEHLQSTQVPPEEQSALSSHSSSLWTLPSPQTVGGGPRTR